MKKDRGPQVVWLLARTCELVGQNYYYFIDFHGIPQIMAPTGTALWGRQNPLTPFGEQMDVQRSNCFLYRSPLQRVCARRRVRIMKTDNHRKRRCMLPESNLMVPRKKILIPGWCWTFASTRHANYQSCCGMLPQTEVCMKAWKHPNTRSTWNRFHVLKIYTGTVVTVLPVWVDH